MNIDNNENNSGNMGNKGKFTERLKRIKYDRLKHRKGILNDNNTNVFLNVYKIILAVPMVVYTHVTGNNENKEVNSDISKLDKDIIIINSGVNDENIKSKDYNVSKKLKINKIRDIDVSLLKKYNKENIEKYNNSMNVENSSSNNFVINEKLKLQKEIINLIKKKLVMNINELEMLQSELYVLKMKGFGETYYSECLQDIKEIKKLLSKVKSLKEKYDYLKDNVDFEYLLEYDDNLLIDKILELKELYSRDDIKNTVDDYKILEEYKYLYLKIDKLEEDVFKLEDYKDRKTLELKDRDINFDKLKSDIYDVDMEKERYENFVLEQEKLIKDLDGKISKIDSYEVVSYRLKGFNKLLGNSFKYLGLLLINPLKGLLPGIVVQTVVTKNIVHNLYNNLEWEENRKMVYDAVDYSVSLNSLVNSLEDTSSLINSTLDEIAVLKNKYNKQFKKYDNSFASYQDAIKKINKIENAVLGTKLKIDLMQQNMREKEKKNADKLKMVKKFND